MISGSRCGEGAVPLGAGVPDPPARRNGGGGGHAGDAHEPPSRYVLVVDDDPDIREVVADLLRTEGLAVRAVADGFAALAQLTSGCGHPCLILLDLMMPRMDGFELARRIRADAALAPIPICTMSAMDSVPEGVAHALRKPFHADELFAVVSRFACTP